MKQKTVIISIIEFVVSIVLTDLNSRIDLIQCFVFNLTGAPQ